MMTIRRLELEIPGALLLCAALVACGSSSAPGATSPNPQPSARTWYVSATAPTGGNGAAQTPFDSLAAVEQAAAPGDTIVVLPSPLDTAPLDGGIALKPGQRLIGAGADVVQQPGNAAVAGPALLAALPRIRNTNPLRQQGDAVRLAAGSEVRNLVITESARGAIYGLNAPGSTIRGNDVSGYNTQCAIGFTVERFNAPTRLPFLGVPAILPAGWAGIMVDADTGSGAVVINDNYVHDSACGNGIDLRINGTADYSAEISGNFITQLQHGPLYQGEELHLVHAITTQITDTAVLHAVSAHNTQTYIGAPGADCEGLFMNLADQATAYWQIDDNIFEHGIGGFSCNGMEFIISNGSAHGEMRLTNSRFIDNPGDMLEQANLGSGSTMILELENVEVRDTVERGGPPDAGPIPFNLGECLLTGSTGTGNTTILKIRDSDFSGCNNGLSILSGVSIENGLGPDGLISVEISNSRFRNNAFNNLVVGVLTELRELVLKVENSDLSVAGETAVSLREIDIGNVEKATIDFGGGALGSTGGNCIFGGQTHDVRTEGFSAAMRGNWWGQPGGPDPARLSAAAPDALDTQAPLAAAPTLCQ